MEKCLNNARPTASRACCCVFYRLARRAGVDVRVSYRVARLLRAGVDVRVSYRVARLLRVGVDVNARPTASRACCCVFYRLARRAGVDVRVSYRVARLLLRILPPRQAPTGGSSWRGCLQGSDRGTIPRGRATPGRRASLAYSTASPGARAARRSRITPPCQARGPPRSRAPAASRLLLRLLADYGRNLVWGGALQGVTELEERERCKDDWWNEVVDELRRGELSEENWRYLHGKPVAGCRLTAAERESRRRVIAGPGDPRLGEEKFRWAAAIVANNDAKYQINKDRAEDYSRAAESPLRWSVALDAPSAEVLQTQARGAAGEKVQGARGASLRAQECDKAARVRWLQYHDRDTENLSGMLPLAVGMRVVLADHLDRAEDKLLLRGSAGRVHSWVWKENDLRPTCVYVKFDGATWQLDGAPEPGLYPVYPARKVWKLDAKRKKPVLKIARTQLPLAPAYATTAHGSQGKTLPAALVDFNVDKR
ncbi:unnamed protein product, partial [Effrenium voratum]